MNKDKHYTVTFPVFHVEANSYEEAANQVLQTMLDYPSSRKLFVREFGTETTVVIEGEKL